MRRRRPPRVGRVERRIDVRPENPRTLIVCEGARTEKLYFEAFSVPSVRVEGTGYNTISLVKEAIRLNGGVAYNQVWCVFDKDSFLPADFQQAIDLARKSGFGVAYSNEAFELWYLLHFDYHDAALSRAQYGDKLTSALGRTYRKNDPSMYDRLLVHQEAAINNAERLLAWHEGSAPHDANPSTTVHMLVQQLRGQAP